MGARLGQRIPWHGTLQNVGVAVELFPVLSFSVEKVTEETFKHLAWFGVNVLDNLLVNLILPSSVFLSFFNFKKPFFECSIYLDFKAF